MCRPLPATPASRARFVQELLLCTSISVVRGTSFGCYPGTLLPAESSGVTPVTALRRPLHVLLTTDVVGGVWDFSWTLAAALRQIGHRVTLLAFGTPTPGQEAQALEAGATLESAPLKLEWMQDSEADVREACLLTARLVQRLAPDVVHANQFALGTINLSAPMVLTAHSDVLSWRKWTIPTSRQISGTSFGDHALPLVPPEWEDYARGVRQGIAASTCVVAVSRFLADEILDLYAVRRPIGVVHNGWPAPAGVPRSLTERPRLSVLAGRAWDSAKNISLAARAAQGWNIGRVKLAGNQRHPENGHLATFDPPIEVLGCIPRDDLDRYLSLARVYVSPALYDPFGLLPLQAALAGCPLLLSDLPSYRELWDGVAMFFQPNDPHDLRQRWQRLLDDAPLAEDLAQRARQRALGRYSVARVAEEYAGLYEEVIASAGSRSLPMYDARAREGAVA